VRCRFFVKREQVQNLWGSQAKKSLKILNERKVKKGVSFAAFKDCFVKGDFVYSVEPVAQYDDNTVASVKEFVSENMIQTNRYKEIIVCCSCVANREVLSHCGTFLRQEHSNGELKILKYYDPNENHFFERGDYPINYQKLFGRFKIITILALKPRPFVNKAEKDYINAKMKYIMTGEKDEEFIKEK